MRATRTRYARLGATNELPRNVRSHAISMVHKTAVPAAAPALWPRAGTHSSVGPDTAGISRHGSDVCGAGSQVLTASARLALAGSGTGVTDQLVRILRRPECGHLS